MNEKEKRFSMKSKRVIAGLVFCSVAVIAVTGIYGFQNYKKKLNKQIAQAEELVKEQQESRQTAAEEIVLPKQEDAQQVNVLAAVAVGQLAHDGDGHRVGQRVDGKNPNAQAVIHAQGVLDNGTRWVDNAHVQSAHA